MQRPDDFSDTLRKPDAELNILQENKRALDELMSLTPENKTEQIVLDTQVLLDTNRSDFEARLKAKDDEIRKCHRLVRLKEQALKDSERSRSGLMDTIADLKQEHAKLKKYRTMEMYFHEVKGIVGAISLMGNSIIQELRLADDQIVEIGEAMQPASKAFEQVVLNGSFLTSALDAERAQIEALHQALNEKDNEISKMAAEVENIKVHADVVKELCARDLSALRAEFEKAQVELKRLGNQQESSGLGQMDPTNRSNDLSPGSSQSRECCRAARADQEAELTMLREEVRRMLLEMMLSREEREAAEKGEGAGGGRVSEDVGGRSNLLLDELKAAKEEARASKETLEAMRQHLMEEHETNVKLSRELQAHMLKASRVASSSSSASGGGAASYGTTTQQAAFTSMDSRYVKGDDCSVLGRAVVM